MKITTPIEVRREIKAAHTTIAEQTVHVDAELAELVKQHGPNTPAAYEANVLRQHHDNIRAKATAKVSAKYNLAMDSFAALEADIDYFSRQSILERAELPVPVVKNAPSTPQENQSLLASMKRIEGELSFNRLSDQVNRSTDEQLIDRWAKQAVRDSHFRLAALITDVAESRGGVLKVKAENALADLSVPEHDAHQEHIDVLDGEFADLKSAHHTLEKGNPDVRAQMHKAVKTFRGV